LIKNNSGALFMNKLYCYILAVGFSLLGFSSAFAVTPQEVLDAVDAIRAPGTNFSFELHAVQENSGDADKAFDFAVNVKDNEKSLVTYVAPELSKGKRLLMVGENLWIYIPNTRQPIRISPQQKAAAGVSNADVARVVYGLDYEAENLVADKIDNQNSYLLTLKAKTKGAAYQRIELWTSADDYRPLKANFYTDSGQKLKSIIYTDYQKELGKFRPMQLVITDTADGDKKTILSYSKLQLSDTPDMYFQTSYLSRLP
jgi:outer membrane lipoprotein-sorting protein